MSKLTKEVDNFLDSIISDTRGPGGAIAVVKDGELISSRVWGYADLVARIPMTERTQMPICSISKHMLVLALKDAVRTAENGRDPWQLLNSELRKTVPHLFDSNESQLGIEHLFNMQSGIRDYWAMTVLWGAKAEDPFSVVDHAPEALNRTKSLHFPPGTEFSYSNVNFHILGCLMETVFGHSVGQLLSSHLFIPAAMKTAALCPNTAGLPLPIKGYEGTERTGYTEAENRIEWVGDAAIVASLEDMIAYEKYLHRSWDDETSLYRSIAQPAIFKDGSSASYSHGLWHGFEGPNETIGHTGALRGFRMARFHVPKTRLSAIVMLNHEANAGSISGRILRFMMGVREPPLPSPPVEASNAWKGYYFAEIQQRVISIDFSGEAGKVMISYGGAPEPVKIITPETAGSKVLNARIDGDNLHFELPGDGVKLVARRLPPPSTPPPSGIGGEYYCQQVESEFSCNDSNGSAGVVYGAFAGYLGRGPVHQMRYITADIWVMMCPRSMDAPAPGEWTIVFKRDNDGVVIGATIGCWLARKLEYVRK